MRESQDHFLFSLGLFVRIDDFDVGVKFISREKNLHKEK